MALGFVRAFLEPRIGAYGRPEDREQLYRGFRAVTANTEPMRMQVTADDVRGGLAACILVMATAIPAALPLLLIENSVLALRISNVSQVTLLFVVGSCWWRRAGGQGWVAGFTMMMLGVMLTEIAIVLGG